MSENNTAPDSDDDPDDDSNIGPDFGPRDPNNIRCCYCDIKLEGDGLLRYIAEAASIEDEDTNVWLGFCEYHKLGDREFPIPDKDDRAAWLHIASFHHHATGDICFEVFDMYRCEHGEDFPHDWVALSMYVPCTWDEHRNRYVYPEFWCRDDKEAEAHAFRLCTEKKHRSYSYLILTEGNAFSDDGLEEKLLVPEVSPNEEPPGELEDDWSDD